ncbi:MAG: hypothetical protein WBG13_25520, partial [Pseudolabrys sp.]
MPSWVYQPPPPLPPPEPPPPEKPEEPDEAGSALAKASLMLATDDDTALLKLLPDHPCSTLADSCSSDRCRRDARVARPHQSRL